MRAFLKIALIFSVVPAFAQVDSNTVTVIASRTLKLPPERASFSVYVSAPITATLDDVLAALSGSGITAADLYSVVQEFQFGPTTRPTLDWTFTLTVPVTKLGDTNIALAKLQASSLRQANGIRVSFSGASFRTADQVVNGQSCKTSDLLADSRVQAQEIATATGRILGRLLAMAGSTIDECSIAVKYSLVGF